MPNALGYLALAACEESQKEVELEISMGTVGDKGGKPEAELRPGQTMRRDVSVFLQRVVTS